MSVPIEDYALIGDCQTAALVSRQGSIDWLCWPRFDSEACFAALLGDACNGYWKIGPADGDVKVTRRYRPDTLILETTFETADGRATLIDFMPPRAEASSIIRIVTGIRGKIALQMKLVLRFGYGAIAPWVSRLDDGRLRAVAGPDMVILHASIPTHGENLTTVGEFKIEAGQTQSFVLSYGASHLPIPDVVEAAPALDRCERFWHKWLGNAQVDGPYADTLKRSLITLKALTYAPSGGVVAAPTTSLPEQIGGSRNWDYRYCWIRDATFTLLAFMDAGLYGEAASWRDWLQRSVAGDPAEMRIMYGLLGERRLTEWEATWLSGYESSKPVRVGNAAHKQFQLDVYGELMDAFSQARKHGLTASDKAWDVQRVLIDHVAKVWQEPDEGIWEVRGGRRHFVFSKVMAWVVFDRAVQAVEDGGLEGDVQAWRGLRDRIHVDVCRKGYDPERNTFCRAYDDGSLDASLLLLAHVGFLKADDPRYVGTVEAIERELLVDGFVMRYDTRRVVDGLPPGEGAFLACSFWLADAYALIGRRDAAESLFARLLRLQNDLGLLAEEYDPKSRRLVGNFPQAFSHVALLNSGFNLTQRAKPAEQRADHSKPKSA